MLQVRDQKVEKRYNNKRGLHFPPMRIIPPAPLEPTTPCSACRAINPFVFRFASAKWAIFPCGRSDRIANREREVLPSVAQRAADCQV